MSKASIPVLRRNQPLWDSLSPLLADTRHDPRDVPVASKHSMSLGMGMTEKQGGSDVRSNVTLAVPDGHGAWGPEFRINGHKWFFSAPMCDAFLVLAQAPGGLSCFLLPRIMPDGSANAYWWDPDCGGSSIFMDGYKGEETIVVDEMYGQIPFRPFKRVCGMAPTGVWARKPGWSAGSGTATRSAGWRWQTAYRSSAKPRLPIIMPTGARSLPVFVFRRHDRMPTWC